MHFPITSERLWLIKWRPCSLLPTINCSDACDMCRALVMFIQYAPETYPRLFFDTSAFYTEHWKMLQISYFVHVLIPDSVCSLVILFLPFIVVQQLLHGTVCIQHSTSLNVISLLQNVHALSIQYSGYKVYPSSVNICDPYVLWDSRHSPTSVQNSSSSTSSITHICVYTRRAAQ